MNQYMKTLIMQLKITNLAMELIADMSGDEEIIQDAQYISARNSEVLNMNNDALMDDDVIARLFEFDEPEEELPDDLRKEFDMIFDEIVRADNYDVE